MLRAQSLPAAPKIIAHSGLPMMLVSSGSFADNGALTLTTAMSAAASACYMYFPAGSIHAASAAGLYYAVMSDTSHATVYNNTYTSGIPTIPASPTAFVCVGPGAYAQTLSEVSLHTYSVAAGVMGPNSQLRVIACFSPLNSATNKTAYVKFGGSAIYQWTMTTSGSNQIATMLQNRGVLTAQVSWPMGVNTQWGVSSNAPTFYAVNTGAAQNLVLSAKLNAAATDYMVVQHYTAEVLF